MEAKEESAASPPSPPPSPPSPQQNSSSPSSPSSRKSRRSVQKRVVSVPVADADGAKSKGEAVAPPSDSWAWRKYGQKPIKGSPYPRGYYRCSSSKGCPARKQVERSRADPTMFIVTYSSDHNHPWPLPKNHHRSSTATASAVESNSKPHKVEEQPPADTSPAADPEERFSDLMMVEEPAAALMMTDDFHWFADIASTSSTSPSAASDAELFYGPIMSRLTADTALLPDDVCDKFSFSGNVSGAAVLDDDEDALFAGLEELPECSIVFRRGFLDSQFRGCDDGNRCRLEAEKSTAAASWCGSTR